VTDTSEALGPVKAGERIEALDVVRGFALLGIFLMNIEFFNRSIMGIGEGVPRGLTGADWFASWFVAHFVQGKFWTIFSLLFGIGFAVMLTRAERGNRPFKAPYLRRILALALFGAAHYIFLWSGDILFSYAVAAGALLVLLYGTWRWITVALVALIALAFVPGLGVAGRIAGSLAFVSLIAIYLRSEKRLRFLGKSVPLFSFILLIVGTLGTFAATALWALPDAPEDPRIPVTVAAACCLGIAVLAAKYDGPADRRSVRLGASLYVLPSLMITIVGAVFYLKTPEPPPAPGEKPTAEQTERAERLEKLEKRRSTEVRVLTSGTYADAVEMRAGDFPEKVAEDTGFAVVLISMFLIGVWLVRSGIMENPGAHVRLFRNLAVYALPIGIGIGLLGSLIATSHTPGDRHDGFQLAKGLEMLGNLPACLGYVGLIVVMLHSKGGWSRIRVLGPAGRMALTNYLLQSAISTTVFYGYGLGHWGLGRAWQVVFAVAVFALQVAFSHWWLSRFRYGPMEWLWRAFTYRQLPAMRLVPREVPAAA
jgi:uncharacterized protein